MGRRLRGRLRGPCFPFWKKKNAFFQVKVPDRMCLDHLGFPRSLRARCPSLPGGTGSADRLPRRHRPWPQGPGGPGWAGLAAAGLRCGAPREAPGGLEPRLPGWQRAPLSGELPRSFPPVPPPLGGWGEAARATGLSSRGLPWSFPSHRSNWLKLLLHIGRHW